jgi:hypothetical protein
MNNFVAVTILGALDQIAQTCHKHGAYEISKEVRQVAKNLTQWCDDHKPAKRVRGNKPLETGKEYIEAMEKVNNGN